MQIGGGGGAGGGGLGGGGTGQSGVHVWEHDPGAAWCVRGGGLGVLPRGGGARGHTQDTPTARRASSGGGGGGGRHAVAADPRETPPPSSWFPTKMASRRRSPLTCTSCSCCVGTCGWQQMWQMSVVVMSVLFYRCLSSCSSRWAELEPWCVMACVMVCYGLRLSCVMGACRGGGWRRWVRRCLERREAGCCSTVGWPR